MWYLIGFILTFIILALVCALMNNEKIYKKYIDCKDTYDSVLFLYMACQDKSIYFAFAMFLSIVWPLLIGLVFFVCLGYLLYKIFSKILSSLLK